MTGCTGRCYRVQRVLSPESFRAARKGWTGRRCSGPLLLEWFERVHFVVAQIGVHYAIFD